MPTPTAQDINTAISVNLGDVDNVSASTVGTPNPLDVSDVNVAYKADAQSVTAGTITATTVEAPAAVSYTQVSTSDEVNNETLNRTAETLKTDINAKLGSFAQDVTTAIGQLKQNSQGALDSLKDSVNTALSNLKNQSDDQVDEINAKIDAIISGVNTAFEEIRSKDEAQTQALTSAINTVSGQLMGRDQELADKLLAVDAKVLALDELYATDTDIAQKVANVNDALDKLNAEGLDLITALDGAIDEVNSLERAKRKIVTVSASSGVYNWNMLAESFPEFANKSDYGVDVQVVDNAYAKASPVNKTKDGFDIVVKTDGIHFRPQPKDCSVEAVAVEVIITYSKQNPLTFNVDALSSSWMTNGNGTDVKVVGADAPSA